MQIPWRRSLEEQMSVEVEREFERYRRRCEELHEEFLYRVRMRDEMREELAAIDEEIQDLQGRGVSLLGEMNTAMLEEDDRTLKSVRSRHDTFSREIGRAQSRKDSVAKKLAELEFDEQELARELMEASQSQLEEATARARELKTFFDELLDARQREISEAADLLTGEHKSHGEEQESPQEG